MCVCVLSLLSFYTVGSPAQPVSTALQQLMDNCQLSVTQISRGIQQKDIPFLAAYFDIVELYVDVMELSPGEQNDVSKKANTHVAMIECLKIWKRRKLSQATFRVLLEMLVKLKKEAIAAQVCQYLKVSVCLCMSGYSYNMPIVLLCIHCMCVYSPYYTNRYFANKLLTVSLVPRPSCL